MADFPRTGGCGDTIVYAGSADDDVLVVIRWLDAARQASEEGSFEESATLPAEHVAVELQIGRGLSEGQCTDIIMPDRPVILAVALASSGTVELAITPDGGDPLFPTGRASVVLTDAIFEFTSGDTVEHWRVDRLELDDISVGWLPG